jgi:hypothetical protein
MNAVNYYHSDAFRGKCQEWVDETCFHVGDVVEIELEYRHFYKKKDQFLITHIEGGRRCCSSPFGVESPFVELSKREKLNLYKSSHDCIISMFPIYGSENKVCVYPIWTLDDSEATNFTVIGGFDVFRELYQKEENTPYFEWDREYSPYFVKTEAGYFTLDALRKGITTPLTVLPPVKGGDGVLYKWDWNLPRHSWRKPELRLVV